MYSAVVFFFFVARRGVAVVLLLVAVFCVGLCLLWVGVFWCVLGWGVWGGWVQEKKGCRRGRNLARGGGGPLVSSFYDGHTPPRDNILATNMIKSYLYLISRPAGGQAMDREGGGTSCPG